MLEDFERELLERALPTLEANLLKFMRWLSVHRRPFQKEALAQFTGGLETPEALRQQLFDRFLLEQVAGGDAPHELAREISVNRLRPDRGEWVQAHNLAANYHMRRFEARQLSGASTLPASYAELRHHLYEAGRIDEIYKASERLTKYALSQIGLVTPVPRNKEALEERIALLSAITDDDRPRVLEYQLARCLVKRGGAGDKETALQHARRGTGRHPNAAAWLLRLNLEFELHGIDYALPIVNDALRNVQRDEDASVIYTCGADLLVKAGRVAVAIDLLMRGIAAVPPEKGASALYTFCANLLVISGKETDAIKLLEKGMGVVPARANLFSLYQSCAALMAKADRVDDAIKLLEEGIGVPGMTSLSSLYQSCAELMARANGLDDAIKLLENGIGVVLARANLFSLYQSCAELMAKADRVDDAIKLLEEGIGVPGMTSLSSLYQSCAELMAKANRLDAAIKLLEKGIGVVPADQRSVLYQAELELIGRAGDCTKAEQVVARGLAAIPTASGRHKIAETGIRVVSLCGGPAAVQRLLSFGAPSQLDAQQRALADYWLAHISGDWQKASEIVHKGHEDFPWYGALLFGEADARVALGQTNEAYTLMSQYVERLRQGRDNPVVWLKAFVSLIAGHPEEARSLAATFAPSDFNAGITLDEAEMLRLWSAARHGLNGPVANSFPGIVEYLRLNGSQAPKAEEVPAVEASGRPCVLAVATEWHSAHGGVSTFNRELCRAFAKEGYQVWCYVPEASANEIAQAKQDDRVTILPAPHESHATPDARLRNRPALPAGTDPDLIISHDRITGPAATSLAENHFRNSKHLLFIHTAPKQIEWFKEQGVDNTATRHSRAPASVANQVGQPSAVGRRRWPQTVACDGK